MSFRAWLEAQNVFGFMQDEPEPDMDTMQQYPTRNAYVKAMSKRGRDTEGAAEAITSAAPSNWLVGDEELIELDNDAVILPAKKFKTQQRPEWHIAIAHFKGKEPMPNGKHRFRILAFWQGRKDEKLTKEDLYDPIGGIVHVGGEIIDVWVHPEHRWTPKEPQYKLYRSLREWAKKRGIVGLSQGDDLTSKSFRASQAKYDWRRAHP